MAGDRLLKRITADPEIFGGKPIIRGMRISVELILSLVAQGETVEAILGDYPDFDSEDIRACLAYAGKRARYNCTVIGGNRSWTTRAES